MYKKTLAKPQALPKCALIINLYQLYIKNEGGVGWDYSACAAGAVSKVGRDYKACFVAFVKQKNAFVPAFYHLPYSYGKV